MKQEQAERLAKIEIRKCGKGQLCSKIIWVDNPFDSKGKPLHDIRNEDPSMRDRPFIGMPIFNGLTPAGPGLWVGDIYNPEDGHVYTDIKLTYVSRNQLVIRGCKAWLLCGEKIWVRTTVPTPTQPAAAPAGTEQIEASAEPDAAAKPASAAASAPTAAQKQAAADAQSGGGEPQSTESLQKVSAPVLTPTLFSAAEDAPAGYGFVMTTAAPEAAPSFSSQTPSSMFAMTKAVETEDASLSGTAAAAGQEGAQPVLIPAPKPKAKPKPQIASQTPAPTQTQTPPPPSAQAPAEAEQTASATDPEAMAVQADATAEPVPMTRRERRFLRRQQQGELPWLQHP
jgi:uncharacterized protein (DUF2147 family)